MPTNTMNEVKKERILKGAAGGGGRGGGGGGRGGGGGGKGAKTTPVVGAAGGAGGGNHGRHSGAGASLKKFKHFILCIKWEDPTRTDTCTILSKVTFKILQVSSDQHQAPI